VNQRDPNFHILPRSENTPWREHSGYLHGIDLFNHGCYWEAHEAWEDLWLPLDKEDPVRIHTQGLIQASAALLKIRLQQPQPASTIWYRGKARLEEIQLRFPNEIFRGIELVEFCKDIDRIIEQEDSDFTQPQIRLSSEI
tara:strand:+ start:193 stop:612 length:420 start_codon:yes stop_codon:yes gene_type:complete